MNWWKGLKGKVRLAEPLKKHTTFGIGGPAKFFIEPQDAEDLKLLLWLAKKYKIALCVIGAGSNILAPDAGLDKAVVHLNSPYFKKITSKDGLILAGAGALLGQVMLYAKNRGLAGLEFLAGIPGTVGGALAMNAGAFDRNISDLAEEVRVMDYNGKIKILGPKAIKFNYRSSSLTNSIVLSAGLKLKRSSRGRIEKKIQACWEIRRMTQDYSRSSAGCVFKNPPRQAAGKLVDLCGLKGKRIGGAGISKRHANFILNLGNAKARDVLELIQLAKRQVKKRFDLNLEAEIKIWR
jgi:UDP-N-acetylmuramate dehydrogenase